MEALERCAPTQTAKSHGSHLARRSVLAQASAAAADQCKSAESYVGMVVWLHQKAGDCTVEVVVAPVLLKALVHSG